MPGSSKKKRRTPVLSWFRKLRHASTPTKVEESSDDKKLPELARTGSAHSAFAPRWVPSLLRSYSEKRNPAAVSSTNLTRSMSALETPLPLTAKNLEALNASHSFLASRCVYNVGDLRRHPAWKELDDESSEGSSASRQDDRADHDSLSDIREDGVCGSGAAPCSSPDTSHIPAHGVTSVHTTMVHAHAGVGGLHMKHGVISEHIDQLMDSKPYGQSISQHVHALQATVDLVLQENIQLRHQLSMLDAQHQESEPQSQQIIQSAINSICVDLVKLQFEVKAKDQVIQKLKRQIATVQQLLVT